ncbi:MAG: hypothetical protein Q7J36_03395 [Thiobacillus sp.]|nr:hypothetical protein [Thiobacillus sp.]
MLKLILRPLAGMTATLACAVVLWAPATRAAESATAATPTVAPFKNYQSWRDEPLKDWRAANQRVDEVGGWRTYLRESQPAGNGAGQDAQGHHGHHGH